MIINRKPSYRSNERGFTLMEILLSVSIMVGIVAVGAYISQNYVRLMQNERAAQSMITVQNAAEEFVRTNFTQLLNPASPDNIAAVNGTRVITVADLSANNYLPRNFPATNALRLRMQVWIRNTTAAGTTPSIEVVTATLPNGAGPAPYQNIQQAAQFGKGRLGILSRIGAGYDTVSFSDVTGQWRVPVADLPGYAPGIPAAPSTDGYIAAFGRISSEDIFDTNVLYRIPVAGNPDLNRMQTELDMNGQQLAGVGTVTLDNLQGTALQVTRGGGYALATTGPLTMGGRVDITGNATIYGDFQAGGGNFQAGSVTANTMETGNMSALNVVSTDITAGGTSSGDLVVNQDLTFVNGNQFRANNLQLGSGGTGSTLTSNNLTAGGTMAAGTTRVNNTYRAMGNSHLVTQNLDLQNGGTVRTMAAQRVNFGGLCYTQGAQDGIPGC